MSLLSAGFIGFVLFSLAVYYSIFPKRFQWVWLLICSLVFYSFSGLDGLLILVFSIVTSYFGVKLISKAQSHGIRKAFLIITISVQVVLLVSFKLVNYYVSLFSRFLQLPGDGRFQLFRIAAPLGMSYYSLQIIGYAVDVYRRQIVPENSLLRYSLFVSYFPQITQGPIVRFTQMREQLFAEHTFQYKNVTHGAQLALWGMFKKMVIADRMGIAVSAIFDNPLCGSRSLFAGILFSVQLFADFSGCMDIVGGCSEMFGILLPQNFNSPFSALSIKDFWRRWHISLSLWLKDYIYIPLGGSRCSRSRKYLNLLITFLVSGFWHGGTLGYLVWGLIHGIYQIVEDFFSRCFQQFICDAKLDQSSKGFKLMQKGCTLILVSFAWIFFRGNGLSAAINMVKLIFTDFNFVLFIRNIYHVDLSPTYTWFLLVATAVMFSVESLHQKTSIRDLLDRQPLPVRWSVYLTGILVVLLMGKYGIDGTAMFRYASY